MGKIFAETKETSQLCLSTFLLLLWHRSDRRALGIGKVQSMQHALYYNGTIVCNPQKLETRTKLSQAYPMKILRSAVWRQTAWGPDLLQALPKRYCTFRS